MRAHLHGGIPKSEVEAKESLFAAHGLDPLHLLADRGDGYYDFVAVVLTSPDLKRLMGTDEGVLSKERVLLFAVDSWWDEHKTAISNLGKVSS